MGYQGTPSRPDPQPPKAEGVGLGRAEPIRMVGISAERADQPCQPARPATVAVTASGSAAASTGGAVQQCFGVVLAEKTAR